MDIKVIERKPISTAEAAALLRTVKSKERKPFQQRTYDIIRSFDRLNKADAEKMTKKLNDLDIARLTDYHIANIVSLLPLTKQELESIFTATKTTIKQEDQDRILDVVKEFA